MSLTDNLEIVGEVVAGKAIEDADKQLTVDEFDLNTRNTGILYYSTEAVIPEPKPSVFDMFRFNNPARKDCSKSKDKKPDYEEYHKLYFILRDKEVIVGELKLFSIFFTNQLHRWKVATLVNDSNLKKAIQEQVKKIDPCLTINFEKLNAFLRPYLEKKQGKSKGGKKRIKNKTNRRRQYTPMKI